MKSVEHLLKAAELCEQVPLKMWPSNSYAPKKSSKKSDDDYFSPSKRIIPGSCISDLIHDSIDNPKRSNGYINITLKKDSEKNADTFIADSTKRIHRLISRCQTRYQFDNTKFYTESTLSLARTDKPYDLEKDTALEVHLRRILIVCLSMFVLCAQHCSKCGCIGLEYTNLIKYEEELEKYSKMISGAAYDREQQRNIEKEKKSKINAHFLRYLHPDVHWKKHACVHFRNFNKMLHTFNIEHMEHVGIPQRKYVKEDSLFQLPSKSCKFYNFESTVAISSTLAVLSCNSCVGESEKDIQRDYIPYVFPSMKGKIFHTYVLQRQDDATYNSSDHWVKTLEHTQTCIDIIYHVAKSMYFVRFFLKGHEGTARGSIWYDALDSDGRHGKRLKEVIHRVSREALVQCKELEPHHPTVVANIRKYATELKKKNYLAFLKTVEYRRVN